MQKTKTLVINTPYLEPHRPPIAGAILCEVARQNGHEVHAIDLNINLFRDNENLWWQNKKKTYSFVYDIDIVPEYLYEYNLTASTLDVDWILLSQLTMFDFASLYDLCKWLKGKTRAKIVVGGPGTEFKFNLETCGELLYNKNLVDYYIQGEGEICLVELFKGNTKYPGINGIPAKQIEDIEVLPLPNYNYYNLDMYDYPNNERDFYVYGSRGCVKKCTFCDIEKYWPKYRYRKGSSIAQEMIRYYETHGTKNFYFADSLLNGSLKEFSKFCATLNSYPDARNFKWSGFFIIRPSASHSKEVFDMIKNSGGFFLNVGIETGVDRIRFEMDKKFTNEDVDWHLENCSRVGLTNQFQLMTTWPSETSQEHLEYLEIFKRWRPYVADGTISSAAINGHPGLLADTRLSADPNLYYTDDVKNQTANKVLFYRSKKNKDFTVAERYQRTINILTEARRQKWPLDRLETKLIEWNENLKTYLK